MNLLQRHVNGVMLQSFVGQEATFLISARWKSKFPKMFADLESAQTDLGISSFGVATTTMEEVFLRVDNLAQQRYNQQHEDNALETKELDGSNLMLLRMIVPNPLTGLPYYLQHFEAMFIKRTIYFYRNWIVFLSNLLAPIVYMAMTVRLSELTPNASDQPVLKIDFSLFDGLDGDAFILVSNRTGLQIKDELDISEYDLLML
ncbi:hypothetical protein ANCCAN_09542 [Ancylostoma caninum]|uniref:Uncharacterized protein n=1 Tax=Ancylostoma caninum TaxID=29170 RepID=A0A368GNA5_ANCCA|nr:hypothetical protein ANCCAN_09542 [Ancylostoma caninum]